MGLYYLIGYNLSLNAFWRKKEENVEYLGSLGIGKDFLAGTQKAQTILREKNSTSEF